MKGWIVATGTLVVFDGKLKELKAQRDTLKDKRSDANDDVEAGIETNLIAARRAVSTIIMKTDDVTLE